MSIRCIPETEADLRAQVRSLENECRALKETLRDRFAMAALTGLLMDQGDWKTHALRAEFCYGQADAMLKQRAVDHA